MARRFPLLTFVAALVALVAAVPHPLPRAGPSVSNAGSSITLLFQNNLNFTDDVNHIGALLLDAVPQNRAAAECQALGEQLISKQALNAHKTDFVQSLSYNAFAGRAAPIQLYYISGGVIAVAEGVGELTFQPFPAGGLSLPVLCTQSANGTQPSNSVATPANEITVAAAGNTIVGYRNEKSFRFLGIPYADQPARWTYSQLYSKTGQTIQATAYGSQCAQGSSGSENCLFLNIQTPYIPKAGSTANLRPVFFYIHGGGFTSGSGADPQTDGGTFASREDIVTVTINYRLSTLGFLAVPGTDVKGNFGIGDQIVALEWAIKNIAQFGGDPNRITIAGESAGAASVRVLLGSPQAIGKFQGGISQSSLGGGVTLGLSGDYATDYSSYQTIQQSYNSQGAAVFQEAGCNETTAQAQIDCLKQVPATTLTSYSHQVSYVSQDGTYVNTEQLIVNTRNGSTNHVPVIFGTMVNDGAAFSTYPRPPVTNEAAGIEAALSISPQYAQAIINSGLFPLYNTGNITLDSFNVSQRVATDIQFRCIDAATVYAGATTDAFPSAYFYQMNRGIGGYDPNGLGGAPVTPGYPYGNPNLPYFKVHSSDMAFTMGNFGAAGLHFRDADDLYFAQLTSGYWSEFVRSGQPNPSIAYLSVRGYTNTIRAVTEAGPWKAVAGGSAKTNNPGNIQQLDYPPMNTGFVDVPQCAFLNYSLTYYLDSNRG